MLILKHVSRSTVLLTVVLLAVGFGRVVVARADYWTYVDQSKKTVEVEARSLGAEQGWEALELADGSITRVPIAAIVKREASEGPMPITEDEMIAKLYEQFGREKFRAHAASPFVIGLVLTAPLHPASEPRAQGFLKKAARFMKNVDRVFLQFSRQLRFDTQPPRFPLVALIFETDEDFDAYAREVMGGRGLSAGNVSGFYSVLTNVLVMRLSECHTFETPLHEAIHQQVYNRQVYQRLAPIPAWFNEGIATGFEGNGERINVGPTKISKHYVQMALSARNIDWSHVIADDRSFRGDVLANEAYGHAWSLHWLLVTKYKIPYMKYVKLLATKSPLSEDSEETRIREFEETFGKKVDALQTEFKAALQTALKRQRGSRDNGSRPGYLTMQSSLGEVEIKGVTDLSRGGLMEAEGRLRNISPFRPLAFHVVIATDAGTYAEWHIPEIGALETTVLPKKLARKLMINARGGPSSSFTVHVRSVLADSDDNDRWRRGELPIPVFRR